MVQLTLLEADTPDCLSRQISALSARWEACLTERTHVAEAARVTSRRFETWRSRDLDGQQRARVAAYFRAVLHRRILRMSDQGAVVARRRLVAESIESDLREAGWDARRAAEEARRVTGDASGYGGAA